MAFVRSRDYFPTTCNIEAKDQNRMKLGAGGKHLITIDYSLLLLIFHSEFGYNYLFVGFSGFDLFFFNTEINRNEDMKHVVGVSFSVKLETGTFSNLLYYEILLA